MFTTWLKLTLARALLVAWGGGVIMLGSALMATHWVPLVLPDVSDPRLEAAIADVRPDGSWLALHVLYADCPCSRRVLDHLMERGRRDDTAETIVLIDGTSEQAAPLLEAGFGLIHATKEDLSSRYGLDAAPAFVVADDHGTVLWRGGYTDRKQGAVYRDMAVLDDLHAGGLVAAIPLFGCAVSASLQDAVDPFGLKAWVDTLSSP